jgi:LysM repeat protein
MRHFLLHFLTICLLAGLAGGLHFSSAQADAGSPSDLISTVNGVRTGYGLPALEVDYSLMASAQATSDTMAASGSCSHLGNATGRMAAYGYGGGAAVYGTENIACGNNLDVATTVYSYWADAVHMMPMVESQYTHIGAGVTVVDGRVYYVIHAAYSSGASSSGGSGSGAVATQAANGTPLPTRPVVVAIVTATPKADGSITHIVQTGQTLWSIAASYGLTLDEIKALNNRTSNTLVVVGDEIIIRAAPTVTPSPTVTNTAPPPTATATRTPTPRTPTATRTATPTPTLTPKPILAIHFTAPNWLNQNLVGILLIIGCGVGLTGLAVSAFKKH